MRKSANTNREKSQESPASRAKARASKETASPEFEEYLIRYDELGEGRPKLTSEEFDRLDDEMLELLGTAAARELTDEQLVRLQELEFLLIDTE